MGGIALAGGWESGLSSVLARSVCPSGLRGYVQVVMFSNAWVQIPQLTNAFAPPDTRLRTLSAYRDGCCAAPAVATACRLACLRTEYSVLRQSPDPMASTVRKLASYRQEAHTFELCRHTVSLTQRMHKDRVTEDSDGH